MSNPPSSPPTFNPTFPPFSFDTDDQIFGSFDTTTYPGSSPPIMDYQMLCDNLPEREMSGNPPNVDMLIRSASSLLSLFNGASDGHPSSPSRTVRTLSRICLLFMEDSSAITAILAEKEAILLRIIQQPSYSPSSDPAYWKSKIGPHWLVQCCINGPMDALEYTAQIHYLLQQFREPDASDAHTKFSRFVYFQSNPKIYAIINNPLRLLFTEGTITDKDLEEGVTTRVDKFVTSKMLRHGDGWIKDLWLCSIKKAPRFKKLKGRKILQYNATSSVQLHRLVCHVFLLLTYEIANVGHAWGVYQTPELINDDYIQGIQGALYGVEYYMEFINNLLHSPCIWKHLTHPAIQEWIYDQYSDSDDADAQMKEKMGLLGPLVEWFQSITEWSQAISEVCYPGSGTKIHLSRELQIHNLEMPLITVPNRQAPLVDLLDHVLSGTELNLEAVINALQNHAASTVHANPCWGPLTFGNWHSWSTSFQGGYHAPSMLVSLMEIPTGSGLSKLAMRAKKSIGFAKPCCECCAIYMMKINTCIHFGASNGMVQPWVLPPIGDREDVGIAVLECLTKMLQGLIEGLMVSNKVGGVDEFGVEM